MQAQKFFIGFGKIGASLCGLAVTGVIVCSYLQAIPTNYYEFQQDSESSADVLGASDVVDEAVAEVVIPVVEEEIVSYAPSREQIDRIYNYLSARNSPLAEYAEEFVRAADYYGIDYRLVASISIVESNGGKKCFRNYNAWGWGKMHFANWIDGIWTVSEGLGEYYALGLTSPDSISMSYCPPSHDSWAYKVNTVMYDIGSI